MPVPVQVLRELRKRLTKEEIETGLRVIDTINEIVSEFESSAQKTDAFKQHDADA